MSSTDRQNRLLVAEDWKRIYQSYKNADFQSYDFDNLRRIMITYLRENYPEDFNDYIESSEYLALIDVMAFLGQSISFRTDLNARENFLELADRKSSVLRLAKLLSYNPKRNIAAAGLLRFSSVQTTEHITDSNGRNLAGQTILWNDHTNSNWHDQFIRIINASLTISGQFGNPDSKRNIYGISTEQYRMQSVINKVPTFSFSKAVEGRNMTFEIVSSAIDENDVYEENPKIGNRFSFLYRDDGKGYNSNNTGFFAYFKQGTLGQGVFSITQPATNESVDIDATNVNNTDVWLCKLDDAGNEMDYWVQVPAIEGNNIIYNSLSKNVRNIYSVNTREDDKISLVFSDGTFGNIPKGTFRVYYRVSNGLTYSINPKDIRNVTISIPYTSTVGKLETLTINLNLTSTVSNASSTESVDSIKANAPATYYTQNRMITGEDYNISPLSVNQDVIKIKSVNRSSSGISRYFDLIDPTGKYSKTNIFSDDGALYKEEYVDSFRFTYLTKTQIEAIIYNQVLSILKSNQLRDFYYDKFKLILSNYRGDYSSSKIYYVNDVVSSGSLYYRCIVNAPAGTSLTDDMYYEPADLVQTIKWNNTSSDTNFYTGYLYSPIGNVQVGSYDPSTLLRHVTQGSLLKFYTVDGPKWTTVLKVIGDGVGETDGVGSIYFTDYIPTGSLLMDIVPAFKTSLDVNTITSMIDLIFSNKPFGLRYDVETKSWKIVYDVNLNQMSAFSLTDAGNTSRQHKDASWMLLFTTDTEYYTVKQRLLRYIFESDAQVRFHFDATDKIYDIKSNATIKDQINILSINQQLFEKSSIDRIWEITNKHVGTDGYVDTKKIQLTFSDIDEDNIVDNPEIFDDLVSTPVINNDGTQTGYIVLEAYETDTGIYDYKLSSLGDVIFVTTEPTILDADNDGMYFYIQSTNVVKQQLIDNSVRKLIVSTNRKIYKGRSGFKFQYIHNADNEARIDPGLTNLMDVYVLTKQYDTVYRQWIDGAIDTQPLPPSSDTLYMIMAPSLNKIKSINDEVVYHPVKYKVLFGQKAEPEMRATFKVVKNTELVISDNDIKTRVLSAINTFFNIENWDFGDKFHFSELQTYIMNSVAPYISNIIIVPGMASLSFGSLYEISSGKDEIFINGATMDDIEIITSITASKIKSSGAIAIEKSATTNLTSTSGRNN